MLQPQRCGVDERPKHLANDRAAASRSLPTTGVTPEIDRKAEKTGARSTLAAVPQVGRDRSHFRRGRASRQPRLMEVLPGDSAKKANSRKGAPPRREAGIHEPERASLTGGPVKQLYTYINQHPLTAPKFGLKNLAKPDFHVISIIYTGILLAGGRHHHGALLHRRLPVRQFVTETRNWVCMRHCTDCQRLTSSALPRTAAEGAFGGIDPPAS